jgi:hypothetical protein
MKKIECPSCGGWSADISVGPCEVCDSKGEIDESYLDEAMVILNRENRELKMRQILSDQKYLLLAHHNKMVKNRLTGSLTFYYEDGFLVDSDSSGKKEKIL